jgi:hypothetical protein
MKKSVYLTCILMLVLTACTLPSAAPVDSAPAASSQPQQLTVTDTAAPSATPLPSDTPSPTPVPPTETPAPTQTSTPTEVPVVESLKATVTADLLSCRYGPGAEYLYFYGFRKGLKIDLVGRTDANNWVAVGGLKHLCWINAKFVDIAGDPQTLKIMYPGGYTLPVSPYYGPTTVLSAIRDANNPNKITVSWTEIALRAGDEEDAEMFIYLIEVWRCEGGKIVFETLASNYPEATFSDEAGCSAPSHGRVFFQEKHGFAGPADIPWPTR